MVANLAVYDETHRAQWPDQRVAQLFYKGNPFMGLVRKDTTMSEKKRHVAVQYGRPQGRSRQYGVGKANLTASRYEDFEVDTVDEYGFGAFSGKLLRSAEVGDNFIVDVFERETKSAISTIKHSLAIGMYGDGSGQRGVISGAPSEAGGSTTIQLATPADIKNFEIGMQLVAADTPTGALRAATAYTVTVVDLVAGTFTVSGTAATTSSWQDGDFLFVEGDPSAGAAGNRPMMAGIGGWIPLVAPTAGDSWFNVDRSADPVRLAGWRFTESGLGATTHFETIMKAAANMTRAGDVEAPDICLMSGEDMGELLSDLEASSAAQGETIKRSARDIADVYYRGVRVMTPIGDIEVYKDPQCPRKRGYLLNLNSWTLGSIGECPQFIDEDGLRILRNGTADQFTFEMVSHHNLYCDAPLYNAVLTFA